jgi:hypothetical protein
VLDLASICSRPNSWSWRSFSSAVNTFMSQSMHLATSWIAEPRFTPG